MGEVQRREPAKEVPSSARERAKGGSRWRDLISQLECGLDVMMEWDPHARTYELSKMF